MEKVLAINLSQKQLELVYRICGQMKIRLIAVEKNQRLVPIENLLEGEAFRPGKTTNAILTSESANKQLAGNQLADNQSTGNQLANNQSADNQSAGTGAAEEQSLVIMCDLCEKHVDKLLAALRMSESKITHKAILTPVNKKWNSSRMLAEMDLERRSYSSMGSRQK